MGLGKTIMMLALILQNPRPEQKLYKKLLDNPTKAKDLIVKYDEDDIKSIYSSDDSFDQDSDRASDLDGFLAHSDED